MTPRPVAHERRARGDALAARSDRCCCARGARARRRSDGAVCGRKAVETGREPLHGPAASHAPAACSAAADGELGGALLLRPDSALSV